MKKTVSIILGVLIIVSAGMTSCKNRSANKSQNAEQKKIEQVQGDDLKSEIRETIYPLPNSAEVIKMLTELEVGYIIGISNPTENVDKYLTTKSRAENLGIYGADLSYATLYNMNQDVINYLDAIRTLTNELNMSSIYNERLYEEIKQSFDNKDKLVSILSNAFDNTYAYLSDNDQQTAALMVVAGAWVEGMYITTHISEAVYDVTGIVKVLLEQKQSFELLLEVAKPHSDDPMVEELLNTLEPMKKIYEGIDTSLSLKNVEDITAAIEQIRTKLIS